MRFTLRTRLMARPDDVIAHARTSRLLLHVASPLVQFTPRQPAHLPDVWETGRYLVGMKMFGLIPMGTQWINISFPAVNGPNEFQLLDDGQGELIRRWRHLITIKPAPDDQTEYADALDIDAGWLTLPVTAWAYVYYLYRQARWRKLVARKFAYAT